MERGAHRSSSIMLFTKERRKRSFARRLVSSPAPRCQSGLLSLYDVFEQFNKVSHADLQVIDESNERAEDGTRHYRDARMWAGWPML